MAFTCTLPDFQHEISDNALTFPIGADEAGSYTAVIGFDPLENPSQMEFYFTIFRFNNITELLIPLRSGKATKVLIPDKEHRSLILDAVCKAIPILLEQVRPEWVLRITNDQNLPENGLAKHSAIAEAFKSCGYEELLVKDRAGCKTWWMWNERDNDSLPVQE
jgi:hypothetical protein